MDSRFLLQGIFLTQGLNRVSCISGTGRWVLTMELPGKPAVGPSYSKKTSASCPDAITDTRLILLLKTTVKPNKIYEAVLLRHSSKGSGVLERRETWVLRLIKPWLSIQDPSSALVQVGDTKWGERLAELRGRDWNSWLLRWNSGDRVPEKRIMCRGGLIHLHGDLLPLAEGWAVQSLGGTSPDLIETTWGRAGIHLMRVWGAGVARLPIQSAVTPECPWLMDKFLQVPLE